MAKFIEGKDCSEYAEDWIYANGGELITFRASKNGKDDVEFFTNFFGKREKCFYHTVAVSEDCRVFDVTCGEQEVWRSVGVYKQYLERYNEGCYFKVYSGYKPPKLF